MIDISLTPHEVLYLHRALKDAPSAIARDDILRKLRTKADRAFCAVCDAPEIHARNRCERCYRRMMRKRKKVA